MSKTKGRITQSHNTRNNVNLKRIITVSSFVLGGAGVLLAGFLWIMGLQSFQKKKLSGAVFSDLNENGRWDVGEPPIDSIKIWLYVDADNNGIVSNNDILIDSLFTDEEGVYEWKSYTSGKLVVKIDNSFALTAKHTSAIRPMSDNN